MTNKRIPDLTTATTPLAGTELVPLWDGTGTKQVSVTNLTAGRAVAGTQFTASTGNFVPATSGKGVDFSAVTPAAGMTSKVLTNYEEGTWTPTQGTFGTWTSPVFSATYTRVGNLVTVFLRLNSGTVASVGAAKTIGGLPFNPAVPATGIALNGSVQTVSNIYVDPTGVVYFVSDTGAQTSLTFSATYRV